MNKKNIQAFIFNWPGCKETDNIIKQTNQCNLNTFVINADERNKKDDWINVANKNYFGGKFSKAVNLFNGETFLHMQGDVKVHSLEKLIEQAEFYMKHYNAGIFAPYVFWTTWRPTKANIEKGNKNIEHKGLKYCACVDESVWFIDKKIIEHFKSLNLRIKPESLGWGIDIIMSAISIEKGMPIIRDYNTTYKHPKGTAYNTNNALQDMRFLFKSLPKNLNRICWKIWSSRGKQKILNELYDELIANQAKN